MRNIYLIIFSVILFSCQIIDKSKVQKKEIAITSPNGEIKLSIENLPNGSYNFSVCHGTDTIIRKSMVGIILSDTNQGFSSGLSLVNTKENVIDEEYVTKTGKQLNRRNHCNEVALILQNNAGNQGEYIFRVYNDGVAYRYKLSNKTDTSVRIELSEFNFTGIANIWSIPYTSSDEHFWEEPRQVFEIEDTNLSYPVLVNTLSGHWALISESNVSNYPLSCGKFLKSNLKYSFAPNNEGKNTVSPNFVSPWRVMILGSKLKTIVESCLIDHLSPATTMTDLSWIKPGVTSFPWWANNLANSSPEEIKKYIDLSAAMKWQYVEFDIALIGSPDYAIDKWKSVDWIKNVVDYGKHKGINCYGWDDIKNLNTSEKRKDVFTRYNQLGLAGIKVDFINSYSQMSRKWVEDVIKEAAEYKLMVSFHGAQSPRGLARQYPHVVTFEAVCGAEYYLPINGAKSIPPRHNCTLPFTRNVLGSMDYTPVAFSSQIRKTTLAHELALSIIFESGWQGMCDAPEAYLNSVAKPILSNLPVAWDETRYLDGYPGEYCCLARRKGNIWYVAGINSGAVRTVNLTLPINNKREIKIYTDSGKDINSIRVIEHNLVPDESLQLNMKENGGFTFIIKE